MQLVLKLLQKLLEKRAPNLLGMKRLWPKSATELFPTRAFSASDGSIQKNANRKNKTNRGLEVLAPWSQMGRPSIELIDIYKAHSS
jgi:hypothetical protein